MDNKERSEQMIIKWWEKVLLKFKPVYVGIDPAISEGDYTAKVYMKFLFGKYYILKIEWKKKKEL